MKTICFFGIFDPDYSRNRILSMGFRENNWNVIFVRVDPKAHKGFSKYIELIKEWKRMKKELIKNNLKPDMVLVAFPGHTIVWLARILCIKEKIYFDAFLSRFDSNVHDRKSYGALSLRGILDWFLDWSSCALSHKIFLDTNEHIQYFSKKFFVSQNKMIRVPVGADTEIFHLEEFVPDPSKFIIYFHGMFIPLQGVRYIIDAADILRNNHDIVFRIIGTGQEYNEISKIIEEKKLENVELLGRKKLEELPDYIKKANICLGIFGDTEKTKRVIPNKVYECIAMKKAVITADTPAIREFFTNEKHVILCECKDGKSIADAIMKLKNDPLLAKELAENSYDYLMENLQPHIIVSDLLMTLEHGN